MKKQFNIDALANKISRKKSTHDKFSRADEALGLDKEVHQEPIEKIVRKTYALTKDDLALMKSLREKYLSHQISIGDSHIIRAALLALSRLELDKFIMLADEIAKPVMGRRKGQTNK